MRPVRHGFRERRVTTAVGSARVRVFRDSVMLEVVQGRSKPLIPLSPRQAERLAIALAKAAVRITAAGGR